MRCNIYKGQFQSAELFGKPVLYTEKQIQREDIPEGWYCYDLTGTDREPDKPAALEDRMPWNRIGSVLSPVSLKRKTTLARQIKNSFHLHEELLDLAGFCEKNRMSCPQDPRKFILRPASHEEAGLFYSQMDGEEDTAAATVGHLRMDFGGAGSTTPGGPTTTTGSTRRSSRRSSRSSWTNCGSGDRCKAMPPCAGGAMGIRRARSDGIMLGLWRKRRTTASACAARPTEAITATSTATT